MKKHHHVSVSVAAILFAMTSLIFAQPAEIVWSRAYGGYSHDYCHSVLETPDRGLILAGQSSSTGTSTDDFLILKTNACGDSMWSRWYGGYGEDICYDVERTSDGGFIMAGSSSSYAVGGRDFWMVKTDSLGNSQWSNNYGGSADDICRSVVQTEDGGYIMAGYSWSFSGGGVTDVWVVRTNPDGGALWNRVLGGLNSDACNSIQRTFDGNYILAGYYADIPGDYDYYLIKMDTFLDTLWTRRYGGLNPQLCYSVIQTSDSGYAMVGTGFNGIWLLKTNANGDSLWSRIYGGLYADWGYSVQETSDGGYILAGTTESFGAGSNDFWLIKTDANGDSLWSSTYGGVGDDFCLSAILTSDGGYALAGRSYWAPNAYQFWVVKADIGSPKIISIMDVGNDQGRQARVRWRRSAHDECLGGSITIDNYSIYRRIDQYLDLDDHRPFFSGLDWPPGEWDFIVNVPAGGEEQYSAVVPTLADSSSEGIYWSVFFVRAHTSNPLVHYDSEPDSGYSIDNLPPDMTRVVAMLRTSPTGVLLQWDEVNTGGGGQPEQGGVWYRIYGSIDPNFAPAPGNLLTVTHDLEYLHNIGIYDKFFYKILVSDDH